MQTYNPVWGMPWASMAELWLVFKNSIYKKTPVQLPKINSPCK